MKEELATKNAVHYFVAGSVLLIWVAIGFLLVTQSKANETIFIVWDQSLYAIPLSIQGPVNSWIPKWFPISKFNDTTLSQDDTVLWRTNYEMRMRYELQEILSSVAKSCAFEQTHQAVEHIRATIGEWKSLQVSDTRCLTDTLSTRSDSSALIATKLPFIKVLARHHAWSDSSVRERVRTLDLQSRFEDSATWWSRSKYVTYAEAYWLLKRVDSDRLDPLQHITQDEYSNIFGTLPDSDGIVLEDLIALWIGQYSELRRVWRFAGKNWKLMEWLFTEFQWASHSEQEKTLKKMLDAMKKNPDSLVEPLEERLIQMTT